MKLKAIVAALIAAPLVAQAACEIKVETIPFNVSMDTSMDVQAITKLTPGMWTFAAVAATSYAEVRECSVLFGWKNVKLMFGSEYLGDKCVMDHLMTHEAEHLRIYTTALEGVAARLAVRFANKEDTMSAVKAEFDRVARLHRLHDSAEEYATNLTACDGRVLSLAGLAAR